MKIAYVCTVLVLAGVAGWNIVQTASRVSPPSRRGSSGSPTLQHEQRIGSIRHALKTRGAQGVIGYIADLPADQLATDSRAMEDYFRTQFALAPFVLDAQFSRCEWAVANLRNASAGTPAPAGFRVVEDFGAGVFLLQKAPP
jgi:hypothetical protein